EQDEADALGLAALEDAVVLALLDQLEDHPRTPSRQPRAALPTALGSCPRTSAPATPRRAWRSARRRPLRHAGGPRSPRRRRRLHGAARRAQARRALECRKGRRRRSPAVGGLRGADGRPLSAEHRARGLATVQ